MIPLGLEPQLASWDAAGRPSQVRLARFLDYLESVASPLASAVEGRLAVELVVGLPAGIAITAGGRDLDNYVYPVAQRLGTHRLAAMFGRKTRGDSRLALGEATPTMLGDPPMFATRMVGSYTRKQWREGLRERLRRVQPEPLPPGPVAIDVAITTGPRRNWCHLWKPLLDAFGPVLGEDLARPFNPRDDRIVNLGLHHHTDGGLGYDVDIQAWWEPLPST